MKCFFCSFTITCLAMTLLFSAAVYGQPTMRQIVQISKDHASQARPMHWKGSRKEGYYQDGRQLSFETLDSKGQIANFEVLFDPVSFRHNVHESKTVAWIDGADDYISIDARHATDGTTYQFWERESAGKVVPLDGIGRGQVSSNLSDLDPIARSFSVGNGFRQGVLPGIPGFILMNTHSYYGMERISDVFERWEREGRVDSIKVIDEKIEITAMVEVLEGSTDFFLRVIYDPATDTIEGGELFSRFRGQEHIMDVYEVIFRINEQGLRVPDTVKIIMPLDKRAMITSYHSFRFVDEDLGAEAFQIVFPDGIIVTGECQCVDVPIQRGNRIRYAFMLLGVVLILIVGRLVLKWKRII